MRGHDFFGVEFRIGLLVAEVITKTPYFMQKHASKQKNVNENA